ARFLARRELHAAGGVDARQGHDASQRRERAGHAESPIARAERHGSGPWVVWHRGRLDRHDGGTRARAPRLRGVSGGVREHQRRSRVAPARAGLLSPGTLRPFDMGLFDRLSTLLRSNINDLISRAEDPEKMLSQILVDMRSQLAKAKQQVATAIADEKRLRDQAEAEFKQAEDWETKATLALKENREDLARQALIRQNEHKSHGEQLAQTWETHRLETEKLKN